VGNLYLLDTNILVHIIRQDTLGQYIKGTYSLLMIDPLPIISVVTEGEIRSLAYQWNWGAANKDEIQFLCGFFSRYSIDSLEVLEAYAVIDAYSKSVGRSLGKNDAWIAATAYVTGATLLTTDKDFDHLHPKFLIRDWIAPHTIP
jgi:tRNA(fMet)-specific endonuclease VapC